MRESYLQNSGPKLYCDNQIAQLRNLAFYGNLNIEVLIIKNCKKIGKECFRGAENLRVLVLGGNDVVKVDTFERGSTEFLQEIDSNNLMERVVTSSFSLSKMHIYVPSDLYDLYLADPVWGQYNISSCININGSTETFTLEDSELYDVFYPVNYITGIHKRVEYLYTNGGYALCNSVYDRVQKGMKIEATGQLTRAATGINYNLFGITSSDGSQNFDFVLRSNMLPNHYPYLKLGTTVIRNTGLEGNDFKKHTWLIHTREKDMSFYKDNELIARATGEYSISDIPNRTLCLFGKNNLNTQTVTNKARLKFYGLKIWNPSDILEHNFVPTIVDDSGDAYLYDLVTGSGLHGLDESFTTDAKPYGATVGVNLYNPGLPTDFQLVIPTTFTNFPSTISLYLNDEIKMTIDTSSINSLSDKEILIDTKKQLVAAVNTFNVKRGLKIIKGDFFQIPNTNSENCTMYVYYDDYFNLLTSTKYPILDYKYKYY